MTVYFQQFDFNKIPLKGVVIERGTTAPASPADDQLWVDTNSTPGVLKKYDGSTWVEVGFVADDSITDAKINTAAGIQLSKLATDPLARAGHTGTQTASTISDFDTQVRTSRLDQMAAPTADLNINSRKLTSVATPTGPTDGANKQYVDSVRMGFAGTLNPVRVVTPDSGTFDPTNPLPAQLDGVTMASGDRFLVPDLGVWTYTTAGQPADAVTDETVEDGTTVAVAEGTNAGYIYIQTDAGGANWEVFQAGGITYTGSGGITLTGTNFTLDNVTVARGGTGATDAAGARTNLSAAGAYGETVAVGDFSPGVPVTVSHGLDSIYIGAHFTDDTTGGNLGLDWRVVDANNIEITAWAAVTNDINVAVFGA